jgi:glyoxylase-like metal-dependent hydrolase (beta-lactamase superfamily II)
MKIMNLTKESTMYTSNVYLVLGTWNAIGDVNTLVEVGRDPAIVEKIMETSTGVGKRRVEQVVLTHSHYDHAGLLSLVRKSFRPTVCAFSRSLAGVDRVLKDGDALRLGDRKFQVFHTPGHSSDSVCLFCEEDGVLFTGDTPVAIRSAGGSYEAQFAKTLEQLAREDIRAVYPGHGAPVLDGCNRLLRATLRSVGGE